MKRYGAMRFVAGLLSFFGWVIIALSIISFIAIIGMSQNLPPSQYVNPALVTLIALVSCGFIAVLGVFCIAGGQMISSQADIATNSGYLRKMAADMGELAANSEKTVGFFEHITNRQREPVVRVDAASRP